MIKKTLSVFAVGALLFLGCSPKTNNPTTTPSTPNTETPTAPQAADRLDQPIPMDPNVKMGVLENGLTYYIRNNVFVFISLRSS